MKNPARSAAAIAALTLASTFPLYAQQIETRRLSVPDDFWTTGISWDGRYFSSAWFPGAPGVVALMEIATGEVERLDAGLDPESSAFPDWSQVSRDGSRVAFTTFNGEGWDLRVVERGGEAQVLLDDSHHAGPDGWYPYATDWSPDGRHVVVVMDSVYRANRIALVSPEDGSARVLRIFEEGFPGPPRMSPDGRWVAYDLPEEARSLDRDVWVVSADGETARKVADSPATDILLGWLPDGSGIVFQSDRDGTDGWWIVPVDDRGRPGPSRKVRSDMWGDPSPIGMTADGSLYYTVRVGRRELFVAGYDAATAELNGTLQRVNGDYPLVGGRAGEWSPDGERIVFVSREGRPEWGTGKDRLVIWSAATGELQALSPDVSLLGSTVRWAPDGRSFLAGATRDGVPGLFRIDPRDGSVTPLLTGEWPNSFVVTADGSTIYFHRRSHREGIVALDLATGDERPLYVKPEGAPRDFDAAYGFMGMRLSHDERTLLLRSYGSDAVLTLPTSGGTPEVALRMEDGERVAGMRWAEDDRSVFLNTRRTDGEGIDLWRLRLDTREREHVTHCTPPSEPAPCFGQVSPDGRRLAFGVGENRTELWVARGFASAGSEEARRGRR